MRLRVPIVFAVLLLNVAFIDAAEDDDDATTLPPNDAPPPPDATASEAPASSNASRFVIDSFIERQVPFIRPDYHVAIHRHLVDRDDGLPEPPGTFLCAGTVVSTKRVLTVAHCVTRDLTAPMRAAAVQVLFGSRTRSGNRALNVQLARQDPRRYGTHQMQWLEVVAVLLHPQYRPLPRPQHDLAVLVTRRPLRLLCADCTSNMVVLPGGGRPAPGTVCTVMGWSGGVNNATMGEVAERVTVQVVTDEQCARKYGMWRLPRSALCALSRVHSERKLRTLAFGDGGGGLVCDQVLYGVVSFGPAMQDGQTPIVYADVHAEMRFVLSAAAGRWRRNFEGTTMAAIVSLMMMMICYAALY